MVRPHIEWKINITQVITFTVMIVTAAGGWYTLKANHDALAKNVEEHKAWDDKRFADFANKDVINAKLDALLAQNKEFLDRLKRLEAIHMGNK